MGAEVSNTRGREPTSPKSRNQLCGTNNLTQLQFHSVHGENIRISANGTVARRVESFCRGITFTNRPVRIKESVSLKFTEISTSWSGAIRFGFTRNDPTTYRNCLPKYACPDLKSKPGNWAKALPERFARLDSVITFQLNEEGNILYSLDGEEKGVFMSDIPTNVPLWAIIDVYGNTCGLELIDQRLPRHSNRNCEVEVLSSRIAATTVRETEEPRPVVYADVNFRPLRFHKTIGCNVRLSNDRCVAERNDSHYCQGYVFSERPLDIEEKLVFQILKTDDMYIGSLAFGLTTCNPATINTGDLPDDPHMLLERPEYWVVIKDVFSSLVAGDEIAIQISPQGEVHLFKNRQPRGPLMHVDQTQRFYAFFDLYASTIKVRSLGIVDSQTSQYTRTQTRSTPRDIITQVPQPAKPNITRSHDSGGSEDSIGDECIVCSEKPINSVLYMCGHMCMCYDCALKQWKGAAGGQCPLCRAIIRDVIRTYRP